jgi:hypothetical protein
MTQASSIIRIFVPAKAVWRLISDFGAAGQYLAGVVDCTVEGEGVGAVRTLTNADGSTIVERLEALDATALRLSYALLTNTPFSNCVMTMYLCDLGPNQSELVWSANFQPAGIPANEASDLLEGALAANCLALKKFIEADWK